MVDRLWSILPLVYTSLFTFYHVLNPSSSPPPTPRALLMTSLVVIWGTRLTYNFYRKGGYKRGEEDYRWPALRAIIRPPLLFLVFNLVFIATIQNLLLLLMTLPIYVASKVATPLNEIDAAASILFLLFLAGEVTADQQQWAFQKDKKRQLDSGKKPVKGDAALGFLCSSGLFRFSRHPNFFCEQAMWWCIYLFSVAATRQWLHYSIIGTLGLTMLFQGSTNFTEKLSKQKYPAYAAYQRTTSRLMPWFPGPSVESQLRKEGKSVAAK
eukprot:jgi/Mesvir1/14284/Mv09714-RA.1